MIKKRIAALAMGAALATSTIIAPQASATPQYKCDRGHEWVKGKWNKGYCKKKDNHKNPWDNKRHDHNKGKWDNKDHGKNESHRTVSLSLSSW